jgi:precorrin-2 methylase
VIVPLMQIKQDLTFEIQDECTAGVGALDSCWTVQRLALTQSFDRLPVVLAPAILNLHERIENKLFLDRTRKDSNFKRPHIYATLFQIEKC